MYTSILRASSGQPVDFNLTIVPYPDSDKQLEFKTDSGDTFLCFVAGIGLAMIPAAIASRIVYEKEYSLKHIQRVSGLNNEAYWLSSLVLDLLKTSMTNSLIVACLYLFRVSYPSHLIYSIPLFLLF